MAAANNSSAQPAMWGGRFAEQTAPLLQRFSQSVSFDWRLYKQDIQGSVAHATMLQKIGILTPEEQSAIVAGLKEIETEIEAGKFAWSLDREDVHMNIEATLTARVPAGAKLHTGRSRNDQVATDMRLWLKAEVQRDLAVLRDLQKTLVAWATRDSDAVLPGYTHLQRAQPVTLGHHLLAYVEMLERDAGRLIDAAKRADVLPLGSGAIAGSTLPLDRAYVAELLGFAQVSANSMDSVSDRDFIVEYCAAAALSAVHLSRLSEDLILWSSAEFNFIRLPDAYTTGSSLMPQKKNPDVAELVRGKSGRVIGNLVSLLTLLKGLPMTYNRDLQEDKEPIFDAVLQVTRALIALRGVYETASWNEERMQMAADGPAAAAIDLAEMLVEQGMPFRQAHALIGGLVRESLERHVPLVELVAAHPDLGETATELLEPGVAVTRRRTPGGAGPGPVGEQAERFVRRREVDRTRLAQWRPPGAP